MWIPNVEPREDDEKLNPLGWGTLFFTVWISLKVLEQLHPQMKVTLTIFLFQLALLAISAALLLAIYHVGWREILEKFTKKFYVFPIVYVISVLGYMFGLVPGFSLHRLDQWVVIIIGFLWLITPIIVVIARFSRPLLRGTISTFISVYSLSYLVAHRFNFTASWALLAISALCWWPCIWPKKFRDISVI
jgi:hypothetical protein